MTENDNETLTVAKVGEALVGAGSGLLVSLLVEEVVGDGPATRAENRRTEVQVSSTNKELFPYDTGIEVGGSMLVGALVAVTIARKLRRR